MSEDLLAWYVDESAKKEPEEPAIRCECDVWQGCRCGAMDLEMHARGYWRNPVTRIWEPKP